MLFSSSSLICSKSKTKQKQKGKLSKCFLGQKAKKAGGEDGLVGGNGRHFTDCGLITSYFTSDCLACLLMWRCPQSYHQPLLGSSEVHTWKMYSFLSKCSKISSSKAKHLGRSLCLSHNPFSPFRNSVFPAKHGQGQCAISTTPCPTSARPTPRAHVHTLTDATPGPDSHTGPHGGPSAGMSSHNRMQRRRATPGALSTIPPWSGAPARGMEHSKRS